MLILGRVINLDTYGKIFKRYLDNSLDIIYREYCPDHPDGKYYMLIEKALKNNEQQVIINSEIMLGIVYNVVKNEGIILDITMSDNIDDEINSGIKVILNKMRDNSFYYSDLKDLLKWADSEGSINITLLDLYYKEFRYQVNVEGLFWSVSSNGNIKVFFEEILKESIEKVIL